MASLSWHNCRQATFALLGRREKGQGRRRSGGDENGAAATYEAFSAPKAASNRHGVADGDAHCRRLSPVGLLASARKP